MFATVNKKKTLFISYISVLLIISIMELESMIVSGPSSSGITVFTKQVLYKSDKQFEKIYIGSIPNGKTVTKIARESPLCRACHPLLTHT